MTGGPAEAWKIQVPRLRLLKKPTAEENFSGLRRAVPPTGRRGAIFWGWQDFQLSRLKRGS